MEQAASATYITPSLLGQAIVFEFLSRGSFEPHLERLRAGSGSAATRCSRRSRRTFPRRRCTRPEGGFFLWVELPGLPDGRAVLARAEGVTARRGDVVQRDVELRCASRTATPRRTRSKSGSSASPRRCRPSAKSRARARRGSFKVS